MHPNRPNRGNRARRRIASLPLAASAAALALLAGPGCSTIRAGMLYGTGSRALREGDVQRAVADLEASAALGPQVSAVQNHLGLAYRAAGRDAEALAAFERAVELDCENRAAVHNLWRARLEHDFGEGLTR